MSPGVINGRFPLEGRRQPLDVGLKNMMGKQKPIITQKLGVPCKVILNYD